MERRNFLKSIPLLFTLPFWTKPAVPNVAGELKVFNVGMQRFLAIQGVPPNGSATLNKKDWIEFDKVIITRVRRSLLNQHEWAVDAVYKKG